MRPFLYCVAAGSLLGLLTQAGAQTGSKADGNKPAEPGATGETCGQYGTTVNFVATPSEAAKQAQKEHKLVLVLHVSGNFEDPTFT